MIIVTGGAGFIGSNLVHGLNAIGRRDIIIVDDLTNGRKYRNLLGAQFVDYLDKDTFIRDLISGKFQEKIEIIFHQGACSDTTEWNGRFMLENNYEYSKILLNYCIDHKVAFIYASSAAVYGLDENCSEMNDSLKPLNVYGYSKYLFDLYVQQKMARAPSQIVGLRYFNVYGPREQHKGKMASVAYHLYQQHLKGETLKLFEGSHGYKNGEQSRDFIYIKDVVDLNLWFYEKKNISGIFNAGTGKARSFNSVAKAVIQHFSDGKIEYIDFPERLRDSYQSFTQADLTILRKKGYHAEFCELEKGIDEYLQWLDQQGTAVL